MIGIKKRNERVSGGKAKAVMLLLAVTLIWGTTFPVQKLVLTDISPFVFNSVRFWLAAFFSFFMTKKHSLKYGLILGLIMGIAYLTQTWGITITTASKSGFITSIYIVIVPLFSYIVEKERVTGYQKIGFPLSLLGLYLLAGGIDGFNLGDFLNLICALCFALHIVLITKFSKSADGKSMIFYQFIAAAAVNTLFSFGGNWNLGISAWGVVIYLAIFPSVLAVLIQLKYQKKVGSNTSSLIFLGEPVFSMLFAFLILSERLTAEQFIGVGVLLASILLASVDKKNRKSPDKIDTCQKAPRTSLSFEEKDTE